MCAFGLCAARKDCSEKVNPSGVEQRSDASGNSRESPVAIFASRARATVSLPGAARAHGRMPLESGIAPSRYRPALLRYLCERRGRDDEQHPHDARADEIALRDVVDEKDEG